MKHSEHLGDSQNGDDSCDDAQLQRLLRFQCELLYASVNKRQQAERIIYDQGHDGQDLAHICMLLIELCRRSPDFSLPRFRKELSGRLQRLKKHSAGQALQYSSLLQ